MRNSFLFAFVLFCMIPAAFAQMDGDFSSGGAIRVGASTTTCDAAATGGIRYSGGVIQWCNGTAWANIGAGAGGDAIDDLTDAFTDYTTAHNLIAGRASAAALTAGAQYNTFFGEGAGATAANSGATTDANTAFGMNALAGLTTGADNTAFGRNALQSNTTGQWNSAFGGYALSANTTGDNNFAFGLNALVANTTGGMNLAVGANTLQSSKAKSENTAIGYGAMRFTDDSATTAVTYNTAVGTYALRGTSPASGVTTIHDTAIGHSALLAITTGDQNTAVGSLAGDSITTGTGNIVIGYNVDTSAAGASNELNIGGTIYADLSTDKVGIGVVSPASALDVNGGVKIANDAAACVAGKAGTIRYTGGTPKWEYCDGSAWVPFEQAGAAGCAGPASCPAVGNICTDGTVFAGCVPPLHDTPFFIARCDAGLTTTTTACDTGARISTKFWNNGNATGYVTTGATSATDGAANTALLQVGGAQQDSNSGVAGVQPHQAADYCATLTIHGYSDWYLPSRAELFEMWVNWTAINNEDGIAASDIFAGIFWSSTESDNSRVFYQIFGGSGGSVRDVKNQTTIYIRCARHD